MSHGLGWIQKSRAKMPWPDVSPAICQADLSSDRGNEWCLVKLFWSCESKRMSPLFLAGLWMPIYNVGSWRNFFYPRHHGKWGINGMKSFHYQHHRRRATHCFDYGISSCTIVLKEKRLSASPRLPEEPTNQQSRIGFDLWNHLFACQSVPATNQLIRHLPPENVSLSGCIVTAPQRPMPLSKEPSVKTTTQLSWMEHAHDLGVAFSRQAMVKSHRALGKKDHTRSSFPIRYKIGKTSGGYPATAAQKETTGIVEQPLNGLRFRFGNLLFRSKISRKLSEAIEHIRAEAEGSNKAKSS